MRTFNIVLALTLAAVTFLDWISLFFGVCALVAWSEKGTENGKGSVCK